MKKNLLLTVLVLAIAAGGNSLMAQWAQYHANDLPSDDATLNIRDDGTILVDPGSSNSIVADPDDATNNLWKVDINLDMADKVGYNWYIAGYDPDGVDPQVPAPSTLACKFMWLDTARYFGPDMEVRETFKVQAKVIKEDGIFKLEVKDWTLDSVYNLPETFDPTVWHVLRLTVNQGAWNIYLDENAEAFASGTAGKKVDKHLAILGAWAESGKAGFLVDWMGYLPESAASPTDMPLPAGVFDPSTSTRSRENTNIFNIYPNPARGAITLDIERDYVNSVYELINITGQIVERGIVLSESSRIDVTELNSGIYMIKVTSSGKVFSERFIVE